MDIKVLRKSEVDIQRLAELVYVAMKACHRLKVDTTKDTILQRISEDIENDGYDWVFVAEDDGEPVGWLALYEISDLKIAQIWDWHPVIFPGENEHEIARKLIREVCAHLSVASCHSTRFRIAV